MSPAADIIDLAEFRRRRFAPPRSTHGILSRATRNRIAALQVDSRFKREGLADWLRYTTLRALFIAKFFRGLIITGLVIGVVVFAWWSR